MGQVQSRTTNARKPESERINRTVELWLDRKRGNVEEGKEEGKEEGGLQLGSRVACRENIFLLLDCAENSIKGFIMALALWMRLTGSGASRDRVPYVASSGSLLFRYSTLFLLSLPLSLSTRL